MSYMTIAKALVKRLEACRLVGYRDSANVPTNGYGHTGPEVQVGASLLQEIADHNLDVDLAKAEAELRAVCPAAMGLSEHQIAALISFIFNLGANPKWTIWKDIAAGRIENVPAQLRRFVNIHRSGKVIALPGLVNRREAEIEVWNTPDAVDTTSPMALPEPPQPSSVTRTAETPPTPLPPKPGANASLVTKIVTAAAGAGAAAGQVHQQVAPHVHESPIFAQLAIGCTAIVIGAAAVAIFLHAKQEEARHV